MSATTTFFRMGTKRGAYRHKASETTGNDRRDKLREETGLTLAQWREMERGLNAFISGHTQTVKRTGPTRTRPSFVRWRVTYSGPSLGLAILAGMARRAIDRAIAEGKASRPDGEQWHDPWEGVGE